MEYNHLGDALFSFKELRIDPDDVNSKLVSTLPKVGSAEFNHYPVYYDLYKTEGLGFNFLCTDVDGDMETDRIEIIFHGCAMYDGARHLYFSTFHKDPEDYGYIYYPHINKLIEALKALDWLQDRYCTYVHSKG